MIVAGFLFATMAVFVKLGAEFFGAAELAFYRSSATLLVASGIGILQAPSSGAGASLAQLQSAC